MRWIMNRNGEDECRLAGHILCIVSPPGQGREDAWWRVWTGDSMQAAFSGMSLTVEDAREHVRDAVKRFVTAIVDSL